MIQKSQHSAILLILFSAIAITYGFEVEPNACSYPLIVEYMNNYTIPVDDLKTLVEKNISEIDIDPISDKKVKFEKIKGALTYTDGKSISRYQLQVFVTGDSFSVHLTWTANVSKIIGHDSFQVAADIAAIKVSYVKSYDKSGNQFHITNVTYKFTADMIVIKSYSPTPLDSQKTKIEDQVKAGLYTKFNDKLKSLAPWLEDLVKKQKIADIYPEDTYNYEYYRWLLPIDTRTLAVVYDQDKESFINGYRGDIVGQTEELCPTIMPNAQAQYSMYLSIEFIQNFAKSIVQRYPPYQEVKLNATWVRTDTFQFRLLDLEYVLAGFAENYGKFYQNNVTFSCAAKDIINGFISDGKLIEVVLWKCDGLLWTTNTTTQKIIDAQVTMNHKFWIAANSGSLSVNSNQLEIADLKFNPVGEITVKNPDLAKIFIRQFLNDLRAYTPGTFFKISPSAKNVDLVSDASKGTGLWIG